jgi:hypothetical protein
VKRELTESLRDVLRGRVWSPAPPSLCHDFGRTVHREPSVVVEATCEQDVLATLQVCRERRIPLVVRGAGHSCGGQALGHGGVVLLNRAEEADARLEGDEVDVSGRTTWNALEAFLGARGRSAIVLPDHLDLTVGGTLSVGGYGVRSVAWGSQADRARSVRLITPDGDVRWRPAEDPLVRHALAGLGRVGVIERVRLPTLSSRPVARWCTRSFGSLPALARWLGWVHDVEHPDLWLDAWWDGDAARAEWGIEAPDVATARATTVPGPKPDRDQLGWHLPLLLHDQRWRWVQRFGGHRRLWIDFMLPHEPFVALCEHLHRLRDEGEIMPTAAYVLVSRRPSGRVPAAHSPSPWPLCFGLGLYFMVPAEAPTGPAEQTIERVRQHALALGGRAYRYGWGAAPPRDPEIERLRAQVGAEPWFSPWPRDAM